MAGINATNGVSPDGPRKGVQAPQEKEVSLNSVFGADSDGGEEITQKEYEQLSAKDKKVVDSWQKLVKKFLGKDAKLTDKNLSDAQIMQGLEEQEAMVEAEMEKLKNMSIIQQYVMRNKNIKEADLLSQLKSMDIDIETCSKEVLEKALRNIEVKQNPSYEWGL